MPKSESDALAAAVQETVRLDDAVRTRLSSFLILALDEGELVLRHGAAPVKQRLIQSILSNAVKDSSRRQDEDEVRAESRVAMQELFSRVLTGLDVKQVVRVVASDVQEDLPR